MSSTGQISVRLQASSRDSVHIESSRPTDIGRLFIGCAPAQVMQRMPILYALCRQGQSLAAAHALQAAGGADAAPAKLERAAHLEVLQEYLWRLHIDLPTLMGQAPRLEDVAALRREGAAWLDSNDPQAPLWDRLAQLLMGDEPLRAAPAGPLTADCALQWLAQKPCDLAWRLEKVQQFLAPFSQADTAPSMQDGPATFARTGPMLDDCPSEQQLRNWADRLGRDATFASRPTDAGGAQETGALAYQFAHSWLAATQGQDPVVRRLLARIIDMQVLMAGLRGVQPLNRSGGLATGPRSGLGWVQTARGLLLHTIVLNSDGVVERYRILAPTEWNFHPRGALNQALQGWQSIPDLARARWFGLHVLSLDPCVPCHLEVV